MAQRKRSPLDRIIQALVLVLCALVVLPPGIARADYVGTGSVALSLDPASEPVVENGYQVGDEISFILQQAPTELDNGNVNGIVAYGTIYVPAGVEVIGAEFVKLTGGTYTAIPAEDVAAGPDGWGNRGSQFTNGVVGNDTDFKNGKINEVQQDTGIFYSTDTQTQLIAPLSIETTGSKPKLQNVHNQWDYNQILAFGAKDDALSGNEGKGNTPVVATTNGGSTYVGTGSGVAGPDTYYTNDYDPGCSATTGANAVKDDLRCAGPWQRIQYTNAKIGGSGAITPATSTGALVNTSVATSAGHVLSSGNPLNSATNAVRYVFGARSVGDLELARITFKVTDVAAFTAAIQNNTFCADGTGGDHDKDGRGAQDSIWRYYEGNNHTCFEGAPAASLTKVPEYVNGSASSDVVPLSSVIGYKMTFANTSGATLYDIRLIDTPLTNLTLVEATTPTCPYANYNGNKAGLPTFISIGDGTQATWNSLATLAAGESVTVHMCGVVNGSASDGEEVRNQIKALYKESVDGEDKELIAKTLQLVVDGPLAVSLSRFEAERTGEIVHLQWETATETANAGFNLYVETGDGLELLNETLIPSTVIDSVAPTFYSYEARSDGDLFHIEMVSIHGRAETFGPFAAVESGAAPQINLDKALWIPMVVQ